MMSIVAFDIVKYNWDGEFLLSVVDSETDVEVVLRTRRSSVLTLKLS